MCSPAPLIGGGVREYRETTAMNRGADLPLQGKVALVTGGSRRIGKAIALKLATAGAALAVNARTSRAEVDAMVAEIEAQGGRAIPALADITDTAANSQMIENAVAALGRLDIVVHN